MKDLRSSSDGISLKVTTNRRKSIIERWKTFMDEAKLSSETQLEDSQVETQEGDKQVQ